MRGRLDSIRRRVSVLEGDDFDQQAFNQALQRFEVTGELPDSPRLAETIRNFAAKCQEAERLMDESVCGPNIHPEPEANAPDAQEGQ